ncbi:MAG: NAD(P)H-hydrate dehydratase [Bacilli bacterium]|jgi:hydroxyethylthiazole kinase-like uncharacterized protein yjeF|nr:NAD(P)H-hydrate dehydratase [Bacilli bacterium]
MIQLNNNILYQTIKIRRNKSHKGDYGRVLLIGGNEKYGGAIILASEACLKCGAGLISVATNKNNHLAIHARNPEIMVIDYHNKNELLELIKSSNVIMIGSGLGLDKHALKILKLTLNNINNKQYLIIDGSAITLLTRENIKYPQGPNIIYTPHQKEWERLSNIKIDDQNNEINLKIANDLKANFVLKSDQSQIVLYRDKNDYYLNNGTPAMATGGMGDVLAGMISGFITQFKSNNAILAATYLHSQIANDLSKNNYVVLPSEICKKIPYYMKEYETK